MSDGQRQSKDKNDDHIDGASSDDNSSASDDHDNALTEFLKIVRNSREKECLRLGCKFENSNNNNINVDEALTILKRIMEVAEPKQEDLDEFYLELKILN